MNKTTTLNGAVTWSTKSLGMEYGTNEIEEAVSIITEIWSSTNMELSELFNKSISFLKLIPSIKDDNESANFLSIFMTLCLYKRDIKSGNGRRDESRTLLLSILSGYINKKNIMKLLLKSYFKCGYWGDAIKLLELTLNPNKFSEVNKVLSNNNTFWNRLQLSILEILKETLDIASLCADRLEYSNDINKEEKDTIISLMTNIGKWITLPRRKKGKTSKDRVRISLTIARYLFPNIKADKWYYKQSGNSFNKSIRYDVTDKTSLYNKWHTLFSKYNKYIRRLRKYTPYVEKYMTKDKFHLINPNMLTSSNKLRYDRAFNNQLPKYLKTKSKINKAKSKYGTHIRFDSEDRRSFALKMDEYSKTIKRKQEKKNIRIQELNKNLNTDDTEELSKIKNELTELINTSITIFKAGTPLDVYDAYDGETNENIIYESCIQELILGKLNQLSNMKILTIADTSGSMYNKSKNAPMPIKVCISLTAFFSMSAPKSWKNKYIQFASQAYIVDLNKEYTNPSFYNFIKYMKSHEVNTGSTNFESVLDNLRLLFNNVEPSDLPEYIIMFSDMQFDEAITGNWSSLTPCEQLNKLFVDVLGFDECNVPTFIFWNLNSYDNRPALSNNTGIVMLSGYNPKMLLDLHNVIDNAINNERRTKIDTWTSIVKILSSSEATVPFLNSIKEFIPHTLL
jgi:hypothetical protein